MRMAAFPLIFLVLRRDGDVLPANGAAKTT